ncbi:hypothetical protein Tco_0938773 [Tanacetum coccineum]|uniref:Uncharacterized protein n=1 Tax=Tanacetum coccineum TaxID=301880 RepID=A0ABQ5DKV0_9ASTR
MVDRKANAPSEIQIGQQTTPSRPTRKWKPTCQNGFTKDELHQWCLAENTPGPVPQCSKRRLIAADQALVFMAMTFEQRSSSLVLHQMTSDHNRSELGIQDHSNEQSSSKLVPKVVPLAVKTATSRQELELLFHHHIAMLRTTGINPMIQPEPEDLPKDNPKLEIAVLRIKKKCMDKGSKQRSPPHNLRQKPGQYICCQNHKLIADIENDIMDPVMQCTTLSHHIGGKSAPASNSQLYQKSYSRSLDNARTPSDTNVFTMKMEILLEPASNKLLVGDLRDSI